MFVEFELDSQKHETTRRVGIHPDHVVYVEEILRTGLWGGAITNIQLAHGQTLPQPVRGTYDEAMRRLKAGHVSARAIAT